MLLSIQCFDGEISLCGPSRLESVHVSRKPALIGVSFAWWRVHPAFDNISAIDFAFVGWRYSVPCPPSFPLMWKFYVDVWLGTHLEVLDDQEVYDI